MQQKKKTGRPRKPASEKLWHVPVMLCGADKDRIEREIPADKRALWLRNVIADGLDEACAKPITCEWLQEVGFIQSSAAPKLPSRYYLPMPRLRNVGILVSFGEGYGQDCMAWLMVFHESVAFESVTTQGQLRQMVRLISGKTIETCAAIARGESHASS